MITERAFRMKLHDARCSGPLKDVFTGNFSSLDCGQGYGGAVTGVHEQLGRQQDIAMPHDQIEIGILTQTRISIGLHGEGRTFDQKRFQARTGEIMKNAEEFRAELQTEKQLRVETLAQLPANFRGDQVRGAIPQPPSQQRQHAMIFGKTEQLRPVCP